MKTLTFHIGTLLVLISLFPIIGCRNEPKPENDELHGEHQREHVEPSIVHIDEHKVFHAGIRVEEVRNSSVAVPLTLPGRVSYNERRLADITARVGGRIEKVHVFTNDHVNAGSVLLQLYSPEFLTMQNEFLHAAERWHRSEHSAGEDTAAKHSMYQSTRRKLAILGLNNEEMGKLESTRIPIAFFAVRSPFAGTILGSKIRQGGFVQIGTELFELADLSTLWVLADIYEKDLPLIRIGMNAHVVVGAYPDSFGGAVSTIYSVLDEKTRTVKARIEVRNASGKLKPEMFCNVKIDTQFGKETIKIPASALLGETERHFVFVALNDTTFERRDIRTGRETREFAEVLDGLLIGEKLVVKGGFFLKSELAKETFGEQH